MKRLVVFAMALMCCALGFGQGFHLPAGVDQEKIRFELVNNLMIIPMEVNGSELSFILRRKRTINIHYPLRNISSHVI